MGAVSGIERLRRACEMLEREDRSAERTLAAGAAEVWSAMFEMEAWPTELRMRAVELQGSLFRHGSIRMTVQELAEPERLRLREELLEFCEFAERIDRPAEVRDGAVA